MKRLFLLIGLARVSAAALAGDVVSAEDGSRQVGEEIAGLASAKQIDVRTIAVGNETVTLNAAYCFQVWNGPKPAYPPSEDENLTNLREYLQSQGDAARLSHLDRIVDFVIRFDRDVNAGDVDLYGQLDPLFPDWVNFNEISSIPSLKANEEFRLLNVDFITYGMALEMLEKFNCGVSSRLLGTTITVDLKLYDPTGVAEPVVIASCRHSFSPVNQGNWFDAHVGDYQVWPDDAVLSVGGSWISAKPLDDVASIGQFGGLEVSTDSVLKFAAEEDRPIGVNSDETVIETDVELGDYSAENLPTVSENYKGGVLLAEEGGRLWFYGLAKVGTKNDWVKLDGPVAGSACDSVHLKMAFRKVVGDVLVKYVIDGVECSYGGSTEIPVVATDSVKSAGYRGDGRVYSLFASGPRARRGFCLSIK